MIEEFLAIGIDRLELDVRTTETMIEEIRPFVEDGRIQISSLHNYCPMPAGTDRAKAASNKIDLASPDSARRLASVAQTKNTIKWAARLGAKVVVVHLGGVEVNLHQRDALKLIAQGKKEEAAEIVFHDLSTRGYNRMPFVDAAMASLKELVPFAEDSGVSIGLETRYYYSEIPSIDEFRLFFRNIRSEALGYWHDVGHADTMEALGIATQEDYLSKYSHKLLGMHIHDAELGNDHRAIGSGKIDFTRLLPFIKPNTNLVMEIHSPASAEELVASRNAVISMLSSGK
jgi:sugar phosphate isomerase/epimerase